VLDDEIKTGVRRWKAAWRSLPLACR